LNSGRSPVHDLDWDHLRRALREATTACLSADRRIAHLGETPDQAHAAFAACERRFGR
jgi:hypothetical protein